MRILRDSFGLVVAGIAIGAGILFGFAGWLEPYRPVEFSGLIVAALLVSGLAMRQPTAERRGTMPPSFVIDFTSLLLFGPGAATLVAAAGTIMKGRLAGSERVEPVHRTVLEGLIVVVATQAAGFAHRMLGGTMGHFVWPMQGVPIAAAVVAYSVIKVVSAQVIGPLVAREPVNRAWPKTFLRECPIYSVGATLAVALVALVDHQLWQVLAVAAVPLYFACRAYTDYVSRLEDEDRRREVIDSLDEGMSVVDSEGRVTLWNDALERLVGCTRERVLGRSLVSAVPVLRETGLPRAISDALKDRSAPTLSCIALPSSGRARTLQVKILPVAGGLTLLWHDVTERTRAEAALKRNTERLALAADGANDGLWEWDLRTQEFYFSGRWNAMLGVSAPAGIGRPEQWIERVHPDDVVALKAALKAHVAGETEHVQHEHRIRHENGTYRWFLCRGVAGGAGRRPSRIAGSLTDITDRVIAQERLRTAGFRDPLTGLRNRADFLEVLGRRLDEFKRRPVGTRFAVLYLDLDRFKVVNDSLGHLVGDELLVAVSRRLESCLRQGDCVGRLGGDEFAILLNEVGDPNQANVVAFRIQEALSAALSVGGREVFTSASIGIAVGQAQYTSPDEIMRDADTAMYHAKTHGKARHELFDADMHARAKDRLGLENDLRHAVSTNSFEVHYQPIVFLASGMCVGFESLVRWTRNGEKISPATFVPMAEELGLIEPLGTWVLQQACQTFADWQRRFPDAGLNCITVNASSRQLTQQNFPHLVEQALHKSGLKPCDLRIEVTETALMDSPHLAAKVLSQLRDFGVKIYLDDFGTGCSSLSHLHKLPVDALKIDRSFVTSLLLPERPAIVESILALARTLKTSVVAEGIESDVQARELERLGCTHAQGYLFSRPLSTQAAEDLIVANQPLGPKRVPEAGAAADSDPYYSSNPINWPELAHQGTSRRPGSGFEASRSVVVTGAAAHAAVTATRTRPS
jgi:diguanylate cyclase (GGDEF)-like protein/PAS domain S-box-containing protein